MTVGTMAPADGREGVPGTAAEMAIETFGLTKRFGRQMAVDGLDLAVPRGVTAGFIGPNGAGKTTTMAMLLGLVAPTAGSGRVLGSPLDEPAAYLRQVGALVEQPAFYPGLSGADNLAVLATLGGYDPAEIPVLLERVGLAGRGGDRFRGYSMGMKQRLGIAAALLGDPPLLILDEPTNGLDPAGIREMRHLVGGLAEGGRTVFVSSHVLAELEQVCDWLVVIDRGAVLFQGPAAELQRRGQATLVSAPEQARDLDRLRAVLARRGGEPRVAEGSLSLELDLPAADDPRAVAAEVNRLAAAEGITIAELSIRRANLESLYLDMLNGGRA